MQQAAGGMLLVTMKDNIIIINCDVFNWQILLQLQQDLESKTKEAKNKTDDLQSELSI